MDPLLSIGAPLRIAALWAAWLLVMLFHVELGLMPLFHGQSVRIKSEVSDSRLPQVFMAMMIYFIAPVVAMVLAFHAASAPFSWSATTGWRALQWWFSLTYSLTNFMHLIADIRIPDARRDQIVLMMVLSLIGLLLNLETWLWWRA